jgi:hypothetical protein
MKMNQKQNRSAGVLQRLGVGGSAGVVAGVVFLMILAPSGLGLSSHAVVVIKSPYAGTITVPLWSYSYGGCSGIAKLAKKPVWSNVTGIGEWSFTSQSKACTAKSGSGSVSSYSNINTQFDFGIPIHFAKGGNHTVTANWSLSVATQQVLSPAGACPTIPPYGNAYCSASSGLSMNGNAYLQDLTNNTIVYSSTYWAGLSNSTYQSNSTYCYSGSCSYSYSFSHSWNGVPLNGNSSFAWVIHAWGYQSVNASHPYALIVDLYAYGNSAEYGYLGGVASSSINMATAGHGWKLNSVKIA